MNKKRGAFLLAFLTALTFILTPVTAFAGSSPTNGLLLLGDSIATGYGLADKDAESYGALLTAKLGGESVNLAVDGASSSDLLASLNDTAFLDKVAAAKNIIVSIGGNDLLGPFLTLAKTTLGIDSKDDAEALMTAAAAPGAIDKIVAALTDPMTALTFAGYAGKFTAENLPAIVTKIKTANPGAALYIQTIYNPFGGVTGMENVAGTADLLFGIMNKAIKDGAESGYTVVDVAAAFSGKAERYTNIAKMDIHPNAAGHKLIYDLLGEAVTPAPAAWKNPFTDLSADDEYYEAIAFMNRRGYIVGYGNGLVGVSDALSRAQFAALLWRLDNKPAPKGTAIFNDVAAGAWYYDPVIWAAENDIMLGDGGKFTPDEPVSRGEMAAALYNYAAEHKGYVIPESLASALSGASETDGGVSRGEAADMFMKLLPLVEAM